MTNLLAKHTPLIIECWQDPGYSNPDLLKFNESLEECGGDDLDETLLSVQHRESTVIKAVKKFQAKNGSGEDGQPGGWRFLRHRVDKEDPNYITVAIKTL